MVAHMRFRTVRSYAYALTHSVPACQLVFSNHPCVPVYAQLRAVPKLKKSQANI